MANACGPFDPMLTLAEMSLRFVSPVLLLLLAGCDPIYGLDSHTELRGPVDIRCIDLALTGVPEAGHVAYRRSEDRSTEIFPKQRNVQTVMHVWAYGEGGRDILQINQTPDGWDYRNARLSRERLPRGELVRFLPLMQNVNRAIEAQCGLPVGGLKHKPVGETMPWEP